MAICKLPGDVEIPNFMTCVACAYLAHPSRSSFCCNSKQVQAGLQLRPRVFGHQVLAFLSSHSRLQGVHLQRKKDQSQSLRHVLHKETHSAKLQRFLANSLGEPLAGLLHAKTQSKDIQSGLDASCGHHDTEKLTVTCRPLQPHNQPPGPQGHGKN